MKLTHASETHTLTIHQPDTPGDPVWLSFAALEETGCVIHGFSTRLGGVSEGYLGTMNLSFSRGDVRERVMENYARLSAAIGFSTDSLVFSDQTHTDNIRTVTEADRGKGILRPRDYTDIDGLVTNIPGITLATFYADCVPLYFVDPVKKAIGLSHSGWKGTALKIGRRTVERMQKEYGTNPADVVAAIGPSICQSCYEVSGDVIEQIKAAFDEALWPGLYSDGREKGKYQLNLWAACRAAIEEAGVPGAQIYTTDLCTCCNPDFLFSHRASRGKRGNLGAFLALKEYPH